MIRLILGLGNPGKEYENTRHNAGRMAAEYFAKSREFSAKGGPAFGWEHDKKSNALISKNSRVIVALPETFMNKSGSVAVKLIKLKKELKPGARVITYVWPLEAWQPQEISEEKGFPKMYSYIVPQH